MRSIFMVLPLFFISVALPRAGFNLYVNERYGYSILYPADFIPQGVSDAGDGQKFVSVNGDATLLVFAGTCLEGSGSYAADYVVAYKRQHEAGEITLTYSRSTHNVAVVSGYVQSKFFYHKLLVDGDWCTQFNFEYDKAISKKYNGITKDIALSFKG